METKKNPVIYSDFPDPDILRIDDTYYMASTTMHYMPGCDILRSYDLINWEFVAHVYDTLDDTPGHNLEKENNIYGQGMWAPSFRYHKGKFYICFTANDTHKTYLFTAENPAGPWKKGTIEGFYYDSSLFFDDDNRVYIVYGQKELYLTELDETLKGPRDGGLNRLIVKDEEKIHLGYEGSHLYKKDDKYYLFTCHILAYGSERKSEVCFISDSLDGEFRGKCIIDDDMGYHNLGIAQGGMVDTPEGNWYAFMFHDRGALGRAPMIMPMHFDEEGFPVIGEDGKVPEYVEISSTKPGYEYAPLNGDDDFYYKPDADGKIHLKLFWQFNHNPVKELWSVTERPGAFRIYSGKICSSIVYAYNTLTQRTVGPESSAYVTIDGKGLKDGDYAGISAFIGCYGAIALTKDNGQYFLVMFGKPAMNNSVYADTNFLEPAVEYARIPIEYCTIRLKVHVDFRNMKDEADFSYLEDDEWKALGIRQKQYFKMDHFTGCRFGLFYYSTKYIGGIADFTDFRYCDTKEKQANG
ncbi:MAG: family 43 glycosylhydrolase [Lachnospiraceae bacterium]